MNEVKKNNFQARGREDEEAAASSLSVPSPTPRRVREQREREERESGIIRTQHDDDVLFCLLSSFFESSFSSAPTYALLL